MSTSTMLKRSFYLLDGSIKPLYAKGSTRHCALLSGAVPIHTLKAAY